MSYFRSPLSLPSVYFSLNSNYQISHGCCAFSPARSQVPALVLPAHLVAQARTVYAPLEMTDSIGSCWQALKHKRTHTNIATDSLSCSHRLTFQHEERADHLQYSVQTIVLIHLDWEVPVVSVLALSSHKSVHVIYNCANVGETELLIADMNQR